jgi:hypothetical protein
MVLTYRRLPPPRSEGSLRVTVTAFVSIVVACLAGGCGGTPNPSWYVEDRAAYPTPPVLSDPGPDAYAGYPYAMNYDERRAFSKAVASLHLGDTMQHVIDVLGEPDWADSGNETLWPPLHNRTHLTYVVALYDSTIGGLNPLVVLSFNYYGGLEEILSVYPGVASRRSVSASAGGVAPDWLSPRETAPPSRPRWLPSSPPRKAAPATRAVAVRTATNVEGKLGGTIRGTIRGRFLTLDNTLAGEFGDSDGTGVLRVVQRLAARAKNDKGLAEQLSRLRRAMNG